MATVSHYPEKIGARGQFDLPHLLEQFMLILSRRHDHLNARLRRLNSIPNKLESGIEGNTCCREGLVR